VTEDLTNFRFNTALAALMECNNALIKQQNEPVSRNAAFRKTLGIISIIRGEKSRSSGGMHSVPKCRERDQQVHEHVLAGWPQCLRDAVTLFTSF